MSGELIGSRRSPYTRRLLLLIKQHPETDITFRAINYLEVPADEAFLKSITPINKIPILIEGDLKIFESRVIANYLAKKHGWPALTVDEENLLSLVDAANDVAVNLFLMRRSGFDIAKPGNWYIERNNERVRGILEILENRVKSFSESDPKDWNYVTMSLLSYVDWANYREMADFSKFPALKDFVVRFKDKPGVAETAIPI
jgi:glutathione S-transferase